MAASARPQRRHPEQPEGPVDLGAAGDELLAQARDAPAGRAARTLTPGAGGALKQTLLALVAGRTMAEHRSPGPATIQLLRGDVVIGTQAGKLEVHGGQWTTVPTEAHDLRATTDAVALLTVGRPAE